jgi:TrmH family RNA methyltransferase
MGAKPILFVILHIQIYSMETITSLQNSKIKNIIKLQKASERKEQKLFLVEGLKEINMAINGGFELHSLFCCFENGLKRDDVSALTKHSQANFEIPTEVFAKIAYREGSDGLMAVFFQKKTDLESLKLRKCPLVIVLESVEKPGNLGAILRTADAAMIDAVIVCDPRTDIFNPNVVRSSIGCLFGVQVATCTNTEALNWLRKNKIKTYAAALSDKSKPYHNFNYQTPTAMIMGTEADGLSDFWLNNSDQKIIIPMLGKIDSLNVSVSTAVLVFEAARQRNFTLHT